MTARAPSGRRRVLHVITSLHDGGAQAALLRLCRHPDSGQHHVVSLTEGGKYVSALRDLGIAVDCLNWPRGKITLGGLWRLRSILRTVKPDIVQTWLYHADLVGGLAARLSGYNRISWGIRNSTLDQAGSSPGTVRVMKLCASLSRLIPQRIICCASRAAEVHADLGYDLDRMKIVYNGYDIEEFRPSPEERAAVRTEFDLGDGPVIGCVARFDAQKDHSTLLEALAIVAGRNPAFNCLLVGREMDSANTELTDRVNQLGLSEHVLAVGERSDIPAVMNAIDIHILSSAFGEAFPNAVAEAMACGTPCISTDVGDASLIIGQTGWICEPRNPNALASALVDALNQLNDAETWRTRKADARARIVDNFTIDQMVSGFTGVWDDMMTGRPA